MIPLEADGAPAPGIYEAPYAEYAAWRAANASTLDPYFRSAAHGHYAETHPEAETSAQSLGTAAHAAILEPERFEREFVKMPAFGEPLRKPAKLAALNFRRANEGKSIITASEYEQAVTMRDAIMAHASAREILKAKGVKERCIVWIDPEFGIKCKIRLDILAVWNGYKIIVDLKTTRDARAQAVSRSMYKFGYHRAASWYTQGAGVLSPGDRKFIHIFVESDPPHGVGVYEMNQDDLILGYDEIRVALARYVHGRKTGHYPGYDAGVGLSSLPKWAKTFHSEEA